MNTKGIEHLTITVSNRRKSKDFYTKLGLKCFFEDKEWCGLTDGNFKLWLSEPRDYIPKNQKFDRNNTGLDHFGFCVESMKQLKEIESKFKKLNIEMEDGGITDDGYGGTSIFVYDPDGMKVEFALKSKK